MADAAAAAAPSVVGDGDAAMAERARAAALVVMNTEVPFKPGQSKMTPAPGHGDRVFYESLIQQRPNSEMANRWCVEFGILSETRAAAACKKLGIDPKRKGGGTPSKKAAPAKSKSEPKAKKAKKAIILDSTAGDAGGAAVGAWEGASSAGV